VFDADRPILSSAQDKLNRATFARYLARCMLDHHEPDSLVVGLYGGWGTGKTSVINLVVEELNFAASNLEDKEKPVILNFSAWSYSGELDLVYSFFRRLSSAASMALKTAIALSTYLNFMFLSLRKNLCQERCAPNGRYGKNSHCKAMKKCMHGNPAVT